MASVHDLWLADFGEPYPGEPASLRPAVVLGPPDTFGPTFPFVIVAPLTTVHRGLSIHVEVEATGQTGLDQVSYIQCELIRSVNAASLVHRLGSIDIERVTMVDRILRTLLNH